MDDKPIVTATNPEETFDDMFSAGGDYVPAPIGEPLKAHIVGVKETYQLDQYKTLPDGKPNPTYNTEIRKLIFEAELDESEAQGQRYSIWVSPKVSEGSNLGKLGQAVFGDWEALKGKKMSDWAGMPFRVVMKPGTQDKTKLKIDIDKVLGAAKDQKKAAVKLSDDEQFAADLDKQLGDVK